MDAVSCVDEIALPPSPMTRTLLTGTGATERNGETSDATIHNGENLVDLECYRRVSPAPIAASTPRRQAANSNGGTC